MSGVALDLLLQAIPVGFVMFVVLNPGAAPPAFAFRMPNCSAMAPYFVPES